MGDGEQTELAPSETATQSARAWGLDELDEILVEGTPPMTRLTPRLITGAAVTVSLVAIAAAAVVSWQHLRIGDELAPTAVTSSMVPATVPVTPTATPVAVTPPPPPPPPVTITTVIKQVPAPTGGWVTPTAPTQVADPGIPPEVVAMYDQRLIANLEADNWSIWDPAAIAKSAHQVCAALQNGDSPALVRQHLVEGGPITDTEAASFTANVMRTYPDCP